MTFHLLKEGPPMKKIIPAVVATLTIVLGTAPTFAANYVIGQNQAANSSPGVTNPWPGSMPPVQLPPTWQNAPLDFPNPPLGPPPPPLAPNLTLH
jgi:hypothetical protein